MHPFLDVARSSSELGGWCEVAGEFTRVIGWTAFGEFFLRNPDDGQYALLRVRRPAMLRLKYHDPTEFAAEVADPEWGVLRVDDAAEQEGRLGALAAEEVFAPAPELPPGSLDPEGYRRENVWEWAARTAAYYGIGRGAASDGVLQYMRGKDDFALWRTALAHILAEFSPSPGALIEVGRCSHWLRPHQLRWTADGGFAWPVGYGSGQGGYSFDALPQFDWSVTLAWDDQRGWLRARDKSGRRAVRIAIPSRTRQHAQAAVREKEVRFYGFRKLDAGWQCTAEAEWAEDRKLREGQRSR